MKLKKVTTSLWVFECQYEEREVAKSAGFRWHDSKRCTWKKCPACLAGVDRNWWTDEVQRAAKLSCYSENGERAVLEAIDAARLATLAASRATDANLVIPVPQGLAYLPFQRAGIAYCLRKFGIDISPKAHYNDGDAKRRVSTNTESTQGGEAQSGKGQIERGARQSHSNTTDDRERSSVAAEGQQGDEAGYVDAGDSSSSHLGTSKGDGAGDELSGRERTGTDRGHDTGGEVSGTTRVHPQLSDQDKGARDESQSADSLQGGLCKSDNEGGDRAGRAEPQTHGSSGVGSKENTNPSSSRLESNSDSSSSSGVLIGDEPGLGKTIEALGVVNADPGIGTVLVLCPATLRTNWLNEAKKWLVRSFKFHVVESSDAVPMQAEFVIVNYDRIVGKNGAKVLDSLMARTWDLLVSDESHVLKNPEAQRTQAVLGEQKSGVQGLASRARRKLFLTGTPILNKPVEIFPLLSTICPKVFGNFWYFVKRYCGAVQGRYGWEFDGATNLDELQEKMRINCLVRRLKKDVLKELPPKTRQVIVLPPNGATEAVQREADAFARYDDDIEDARVRVEMARASGDYDAYKTAVEGLHEAMQVAFTEMSEARHALALAKAPYVIEHVQNMLDEGIAKVIVFAHHRDVVTMIAEHFHAPKIQGGMESEDADAAKNAFQNDQNVKVIVLNIKAGGVGHTLTAAHHVVFAELDWVPANVTQAEDRAHRIGQHDNVLVQHLVLDGSLDARMAKTIVRKQEIADQALDLPILEKVMPVTPSSEREERDEPAPRKYPEAKPEERVAAKLAMQMLAGVCDGAYKLDGAGFNKFDAKIGHKLAELVRDFTDGEVFLARKLANKYRRQSPDEILVTLAFEKQE